MIVILNWLYVFCTSVLGVYQVKFDYVSDYDLREQRESNTMGLLILTHD